MLTKPKTSGPGVVVKFKRRQQRRNPRRPLEAVPKDWGRWDAAAEVQGINWSEFARRAQNLYAESVLATESARAVSEKGAQKNGAAARTKPTPKRAARKG